MGRTQFNAFAGATVNYKAQPEVLPQDAARQDGRIAKDWRDHRQVGWLRLRTRLGREPVRELIYYQNRPAVER